MAELSHGTVVIAARGKNFIVLGTDSKGILGVFLGVTLPDEMKKAKATDYFTSKETEANSLGDEV